MFGLIDDCRASILAAACDCDAGESSPMISFQQIVRSASCLLPFSALVLWSGQAAAQNYSIKLTNPLQQAPVGGTSPVFIIQTQTLSGSPQQLQLSVDNFCPFRSQFDPAVVTSGQSAQLTFD